MVCLEKLPRENFSVREHGSTALVCKVASEQSTGLLELVSATVAFKQARLKWRGLIIMHSSPFGENQTQHISTNASYQLSSTVVGG